MQGSIIDSAAGHGHWCNATKCWSAGWRECFQSELRNQIYAGLLGATRSMLACSMRPKFGPPQMQIRAHTELLHLQGVCGALCFIGSGS